MKLTRRGFVIATLAAPTAAMVALKGAVHEKIRETATVNDPEFRIFEQMMKQQRGDKAKPGNIVMNEKDGGLWLVMPFGIADDFFTLQSLERHEKVFASMEAMRHRYIIIGAAREEARTS